MTLIPRLFDISGISASPNLCAAAVDEVATDVVAVVLVVVVVVLVVDAVVVAEDVAVVEDDPELQDIAGRTMAVTSNRPIRMETSFFILIFPSLFDLPDPKPCPEETMCALISSEHPLCCSGQPLTNALFKGTRQPLIVHLQITTRVFDV